MVYSKAMCHDSFPCLLSLITTDLGTTDKSGYDYQVFRFNILDPRSSGKEGDEEYWDTVSLVREAGPDGVLCPTLDSVKGKLRWCKTNNRQEHRSTDGFQIIARTMCRHYTARLLC